VSNVDDHVGRPVPREGRDHVVDDRADAEPPGVDRERARVEARGVEQLLDQPPETVGLPPQRVLELSTLLRRQRVASLAQGRSDPVHRRRRRAQLVRRDGHEVQLQPVEPEEVLTDEK
jgi:hypothetical protein